MGELSDIELRQQYQKGRVWLIAREQVSGTTKNKIGHTYDHEQWMRGLQKLEQVEDELQRRKVAYGI